MLYEFDNLQGYNDFVVIYFDTKKFDKFKIILANKAIINNKERIELPLPT